MVDMQTLYHLVDTLTTDERWQLYEYLLAEADIPQPETNAVRVLDLHAGAIWTSDDFDDSVIGK